MEHSHTLVRIRSPKLTPHILRIDRISTACIFLLYFFCTSKHKSFRSIASHQQVLVLPSMDKSPMSSMGMRLISPKSSLERTNIFLEWSVKLERSWTYKIGVKLRGTHPFWALSKAALVNLASFRFRRYAQEMTSWSTRQKRSRSLGRSLCLELHQETTPLTIPRCQSSMPEVKFNQTAVGQLCPLWTATNRAGQMASLP